MTHIQLPISKSIANRLLILQALSGEPLLDVSASATPDDVLLMRSALEAINNGAEEINIENCGTAMRFLTAYCAQLEGRTILLTGSPRMQKRPIGQLVEALTRFGADIWYDGERNYPPLRIHGKKLVTPVLEYVSGKPITIRIPDSSQYISAMLLIGLNADATKSSPYIRMTRAMCAKWKAGQRHFEERDWSSAAFWYEYVALHGGQLHLDGLTNSDLQGDQVIAKWFRRLGVETTFTKDGVIIEKSKRTIHLPYIIDFANNPDLYPVMAITCRQLHVPLIARGTASQRIKESDRLESVKTRQTQGDHRIAMSLLAADLPCDDVDCVRKSYPGFYEQLCQLRG
ncbi:MAG: hypothetical protein IJQ95_02270 [Paludibacteraceae bacterium]|nr:hypothetical protein [Paludibacteraceae bacterium]